MALLSQGWLAVFIGVTIIADFPHIVVTRFIRVIQFLYDWIARTSRAMTALGC
ncbi:MAG: hypothetical protein COA60_008235 [Robiginitomaculum sp.]|nr:hypothetical protein [Robiginitomaculum sp.]